MVINSVLDSLREREREIYIERERESRLEDIHELIVEMIKRHWC